MLTTVHPLDIAISRACLVMESASGWLDLGSERDRELAAGLRRAVEDLDVARDAR